MKIITKYVAEDNSEFTEESKCVEHESNMKIIDSIMSKLPSRPDDTSFSNGKGFIQHVNSELLEVRSEFLEFVKRYTDHKWIQESIDKGFEVDSSWAGRIISECCPNYISRKWYRFHCVDKLDREWGQPYYRTHPEDADSCTCINM